MMVGFAVRFNLIEYDKIELLAFVSLLLLRCLANCFTPFAGVVFTTGDCFLVDMAINS